MPDSASLSSTSSTAPLERKNAHRFYRPELDVLRFGAFLLVFLYHVVPAASPNAQGLISGSVILRLLAGICPGGAYGVDLFFCLSSYLITTLLMEEHADSGTIDVKSFYIRRILRIWPLYFAFLLCFIPLIGKLIPSQLLPVPYLAAFIFLSGNWACAAWGFPISAANVLWSVSIEEQFYLSWPLVMKRWFPKLKEISLCLILLSIVARAILVFTHASRDSIFCNTFARLDPIAAGALTAWAFKGATPRLSTPLRLSMVLFGILAIAACGLFGSRGGIRSLITYPVSMSRA